MKLKQSKRASRKKLFVAMLLIVTVIYPVVLHLDIQRNEALEQAELESNPDLAPWIDFAPYTSTFTGGLLTIMGIVIAGSWLIVIIHRKGLRTAMLMVLPLIIVLSFTPRAHAEYEEIVDVLAAEDEEFRMLYPASWQRNFGWGQYIDDAFGKFEEEFGINFRLRGWIDWDSKDYEDSLEDLLDEAIKETKFESHVTTYDGCVIDILMVFTGEPQGQRAGYSPAPLKALIIYALPDAPRGRLLQHELSHQFWVVGHCDNDCIMNKDKMESLQWVPDYWCGQCATTINDHKHRFWNQPPLAPSEPLGITLGYVNTPHLYWINTIPEWRQLRYQLDWGDGSRTTTDWLASGLEVNMYHSWDLTGGYEVRARAQDEYGEWSKWSSSLTVLIRLLPPPSGGGGGGGTCRPRSQFI